MLCQSPHRNRWHVCGQSLEVVERRGVPVQDEVDGEVEGAEGDLETAAEAAEQDVLAGEALAEAAVPVNATAAATGRMVAVAVTRPRKGVRGRQVVVGGGRESCGRQV